LVSFSGILSGYTSVLTWQTSEEINFKEFEVQYSPDKDGSHFKAVDTVRAGGSSFGDTYGSLYDAPKGVGYYRLKIIDIDGSYTYSQVINLETTDVAIAHISLYPNPSKDVVIVRGLLANDQVKVIDMYGRTLISVFTVDDAKQLDISNFPPGLYMVQVLRSGQIVSNMKLDKN
jgi:hypothetical protein